jgi:capsular exopolysaccharide synthesis family protein
LIEVRVYSEDKQEAKDIADMIAGVYQTNRVEVKQSQTKNAIEALKKQYEEQTNKVAELAGSLDALRTDLGIPDSGTDSSASYQISVERESASAAGGQLVLARTELVFYEKTLESLLSLNRADLRETIPTVVQTEQLLPQLLTDLSAVEVNLATARRDYQDEHPDVQRMLARKETLEKQIEGRLTGILTGLSNKVGSLSGRVAELENQVNQVKRQVAEEAGRSRTYWQLKRKLENEQRIADAIQLRLTQERVDSALPTTSIVEIVDKAEIGLSPVRPKLLLNIALGVVVGLIMGVGLAFFIEYLDTSVKTIDDVERSLQTPVIGVIPQNVGLLMDEGPDSPHAEAYRVLRTNVLFSRKNPQHNTLTVVSGGAGEGKSTTIFNLATVFAQNGARVLVVDSDLRRPSLHKFLNLTNSVGLTNFLLKQNSLEEVVQTTKMPTLDFLPSGKLPSSALGLLNSTRMQDFIKDVKQRYDFVFFDSPPIMGVSDASILASEVDLAILVVQYRKYPQAINLRAKQMVEKVGGNLLGVVLNNINISQDSYYYYYSGYYYDYYSKDESSEDSQAKPAVPAKTESASTKAGQLEQKF